MAERNHDKISSLDQPPDWLEHRMGTEMDTSMSQVGRSRMDSVSRVAIRNIKPPQVDTNDPDQQKLVENLNTMEAKIWNYSDNKPSFLATLNKNNPTVQRKVIESIVKGNSTIEHYEDISRSKPQQQQNHSDDQKPNESKSQALIRNQKRVIFNQSPAAQISLRASTDDDDSSDTESDTFTSIKEAVVTSQVEMKMVIKKTIELVDDMNKSVELVFHATRATARFLTYPTPSIPSDNYVFGHVKGWIWLIYKGLSTFNGTCEDGLLKELLRKLRKEMNKLANQASDLTETFQIFNTDLRSLQDSVKKEAKYLKAQSTMWSLKIDGYLRYAEELRSKRDLLLNIKEDRPFSSDWVFHPHPSKAELRPNFFHFQWIKTKGNWETVDFEIRSDYSTRWHPYSSFRPRMQMEIVFHLIDHLSAILEEATNFVKINMRLTFDFDEIKCLRFAVAEINSVKKNKRTAAYVGDMTRKLFEDMALLEEISQEFMNQLLSFQDTIDPCYESLKKQINPKADGPLLPLDHRSEGRKHGCCSCFPKSNKDFLQVYGTPMLAVFLRTPISEETVDCFFPKDHLIHQHNNAVTEQDINTTSHRINQYGISEGYNSSLFDGDIGRDPPTKVPKRLPKVRRKSIFSDQGFNLRRLVELSEKVIRTKDGELDMEIYLQIFEQIRKFFQAFGSMFNFIVSELTERLENLENRLYTQLSDYYESLEKMVDHEIMSEIIESDPVSCGTRAFQKVHIAFLFFTLFMDNLTRLEQYEATSFACKSAYYKSYAKYHSWFVQKASMFSIYSIPSKIVVYNKVLPGIDVAEVDALLVEFVECGVRIYEHCENVFKQKEVNDL